MEITKPGGFVSDIEDFIVRRHTKRMFGAQRVNLAGDGIADRYHSVPKFCDFLQLGLTSGEQGRDTIELNHLRLQTSDLDIKFPTNVGIDSRHPFIEKL